MPNGKPNILVIWGDDIGISNLSCYSDGMMGYRTPNIDRIAHEGMRFTDSYGEQSCTAGRAARCRHRLGRRGPDHRRTAQAVGIRHRAVRQEPLRRPEQVPADRARVRRVLRQPLPPQRRGGARAVRLPPQGPVPAAVRNRAPRGVLKCKATDEVSTEPDDPKFGPVGKQTIEDTGPLTAKRMETIDDDIADRTVEYIKRQHAADTPFFVWCNFTHMHLYTHLKPGSKGQAGMWQSEYHDAMIDHDRNVGTVLDELDIAEDTIVIYSTDNGPHRNSWPDAGTTPFRSEKNTNWEGAYRVPELIRWPGKIKAGSVSNDIVQHHDWLPTLVAAAGDPDVSEKLKKGHQAGDTEYKVHIDGFNLLPYLMGEVEHSPRRGFFYFNDDAEMVGMRFENWKIVFAEQRCQGTLRIWAEPFTELRIPKLFNLRTDPFEYADITSNTYYDWFMRRDFFVFYATAMASMFLDTFKEFPPRHPPASFSIDQIVKKLNDFLAAD
jgi:arylsulfatase